MRHHKPVLLILAIGLIGLTGCAPYRTSSNINQLPASNVRTQIATADADVVVYQGDVPGRKYEKIGYLQVTIKKLTLFHKDPTREQADDALRARAREMGADAVVHATYKSGVGLTTWGYINATGTAIRFID